MDIAKALELLEQELLEVPRLKELSWNDPGFALWRNKVEDILEAAFSEQSNEYRRFHNAIGVRVSFREEERNQMHYIERLTNAEVAIKSTIRKCEMLGISKAEPLTPEKPRAFIAHGGKSQALDKLKEFLRALDVEPLVVEELPSEGRSVDQNVEWYLNQADCEIILATYGGIKDEQTGARHPRLNVVDELARGRKRFLNKIILLLEEEVELSTNISGIAYERFKQDNMEKAFIKVAKELMAFGILRANKPAK